MSPSAPSPAAQDEGIAVILALVVTALLASLGLTLVILTDTERRLSANYRTDQATRYAASAAAERAIADLAAVPDWSAVLAGVQASTFVDSTRQPIVSGRTIDLDALTIQLQASLNGGASFGANTPAWRLYSWGALNRLLPAGHLAASQYLAAWVADDLDDADGDPLSDSNNVVTIHAEAFGPGGGRRVVDAAVQRLNGHVQLMFWREL